MEQILTTIWALIAPLIIALVVAVVAAWGNAMIYAAQMIYQAYLNKDLKTGPDKMAWVVKQVKAYLPRVVAMVISDEKVRRACQSIYDTIKSYALAYMKNNIESNAQQQKGAANEKEQAETS